MYSAKLSFSEIIQFIWIKSKKKLFLLLISMHDMKLDINSVFFSKQRKKNTIDRKRCNEFLSTNCLSRVLTRKQHSDFVTQRRKGIRIFFHISSSLFSSALIVSRTNKKTRSDHSRQRRMTAQSNKRNIAFQS